MVWEIVIVIALLIVIELVAMAIVIKRKADNAVSDELLRKETAKDAQRVKAMIFNDNENVNESKPATENNINVKELIEDINNMAYGNKEMSSTYIGSKQTMKYHLASCKLARNVFPEHKIENNSIDYFKKNKFKACKRCMKK